MRRASYAGEAGVMGGEGYPLIPMQPETKAHLGRFSGQPSKAYKSALNRLIFRAKAIGVWSLFQDLWIAVADSQADALRNLVAPARDATIVGGPTFTANKGFSGLGAANYASLPYSQTNASWTSGFIAAGKLADGASGYVGAAATTGSLGLGSNPAAIGWTHQTGLAAASWPSVAAGDLPGPVCVGALGTAVVTPTSTFGSSGTANPLVSSPLLFNNPSFAPFLAYGVIPFGATKAQLRRFLAALNEMLSEIGAYE